MSPVASLDGQAEDAGPRTPSQSVRDLSLYIHFPFCARKCPYCDFNAHARTDIPEEAYVAGILWRLQCLARDEASAGDRRRLVSIFFGGGTPSLLSPSAVCRILEGVGKHFSLSPTCEITLEANPSSAERAKFASLRAAGVNRVSLGVQSFDDKALAFLGRLHDAQQARAAIEAASLVFARVSFDLITALPRQSEAAIVREIAEAATFATEHLCVYQLTIEKATAFHRQHARGDFKVPSAQRAAQLYRIVEQAMQAHRYANYEISCYARSREAQSRHNLVYWRSGDWIGIGAGAHGRLTHNSSRIATLETRDPDRWIRQALAQDARIEKRIVLCEQEVLAERVMMGLRLTEGVPIALFKGTAYNLVEDLCKAGYCEKTTQRLILTQEGRLRLDTIVASLVAELAASGDENAVGVARARDRFVEHIRKSSGEFRGKNSRENPRENLLAL